MSYRKRSFRKRGSYRGKSRHRRGKSRVHKTYFVSRGGVRL